MSFFDGTQVEIGRGAQAKVYRYQGYAYKVYDETYPREWIQGEKQIQQILYETNLPVVKYYETEQENIIKMDLIDGTTLAEHMEKTGYVQGLEILIKLQKEIISYDNTNFPSFFDFSVEILLNLQCEENIKEKALGFLSYIPQKPNLLHLDMHFLNIMISKNNYFIIDWINARTGNPIFEFARSFVILNEFAPLLAQEYKKMLEMDDEISCDQFNEAVFVQAVLRIKEHENRRTQELINALQV